MEEYFQDKKINLLQQSDIQLVKQISRNDIYAINQVKVSGKDQKYLMKSYKFVKQVTESTKQQIQRILQFLLTIQNEAMVSYEGFILDIQKDQLNVLLNLNQSPTITLFESIYLRKANRGNQTFTEGQIIEIGIKLLEILLILHKNQYIHGNIHPNNMFITDNQVKLGEINYKIVKVSNHKKCRSQLKEKYRSPQSQLKKNYSFADDIWAFGCVMYEMATSEPYVKQLEDIQFLMHDDIAEKRFEQISKIYSENFIEFLKMCLCFDPEKRAKSDELLYFLKNQENTITKWKEEKNNLSLKRKGKVNKKKTVHFDQNVMPESQAYEKKSIIQILMQDKKQCESQQMIECSQETSQCNQKLKLEITFPQSQIPKLAEISSATNCFNKNSSQCFKPNINVTFSPREKIKFLSSDFEKYLENLKIDKNKFKDKNSRIEANVIQFSKTTDLNKMISPRGVLQNSLPFNQKPAFNQKYSFNIYNTAKMQKQQISQPINFTKRQSQTIRDKISIEKTAKVSFSKKIQKISSRSPQPVNLLKKMIN